MRGILELILCQIKNELFIFIIKSFFFRLRSNLVWTVASQMFLLFLLVLPSSAYLSLLFLCLAREHPCSRRLARSFPSACLWVSLCVYAEGFQQGREMPTKIIFDTEDHTMDEEVDTVAEAKTLKVSRAGPVLVID